MRKKRMAGLFLSVVLAVSMLSACGSSKASADASSAAESFAEEGKNTVEAQSGTQIGDFIQVTDGSEDAMDINTATTATLAGISMCRHLYEGLYKLDEKGNVVLGQAASVDVSDDGLVYTFTLRDDITWSDGKPVAAGDFIYGWKFLKDSSADYSSILDMVSKCEAKDDKTLVVELAYPCSYLPCVLAFPSSYPVRQDIVESAGEAYATDPDKAVYNGAFKLTDWTHQQEMTLVKRDDYYDADKISVTGIKWELMSDAATMESSFKSGDVLYSDSYSEEDVDALTDNGLHFEPGYNTYCAMFNLGDKGSKVLKNAKIRKAMSLAVDRKRLINIRGLGDEFACTYTPSGFKDDSGKEFWETCTPWFSEDYDANVEEAKQLFDEGLKEEGIANASDFPSLRYIVNNDSRKTIAEAVVADWAEKLGIQSITVESVDNFFAARTAGDYDIAYYGWYMDYEDISNMLYTMTTGQNNARYSSDAYDEAYKSAMEAKDQDGQWTAYAKCESVLSEDVPIVPMLHSKNSYLFDDTDYSGLVYYCGTPFFGYLKSLT